MTAFIILSFSIIIIILFMFFMYILRSDGCKGGASKEYTGVLAGSTGCYCKPTMIWDGYLCKCPTGQVYSDSINTCVDKPIENITNDYITDMYYYRDGL